MAIGIPMVIQAAPQPSNPILSWTMDNLVLVIGIVIILGVLLSLMNTMNALFDYKHRELLASQGLEMPERKSSPSIFSNIWKKLSGLRPIEQEVDIDLGHDYDGIRELDNKLPPWWLYLFYGTIIWALGYMYVYHFSDIGKSSLEEYAAQMEIADDLKLNYLYKMSNSVNENNVVQLTEIADLEEGKNIFIKNCAVCHGNEGQGGVGPNMTDNYFVHGPTIQDIFSVVKYGVPEKGMIAWQTQLNPSSMQKVASFIMTLPGTNPPNQKKAEGKLYEENAEVTQ